MTRLIDQMNKRTGFTLIEIMVVVLIMSVLIMLAVPSWLGARSRSQTRTCVAQLRQIRNAKESWAMENRKGSMDVPEWANLCPDYLKEMPTCPAGGDYTIGAIITDPTCSLGGTHVLD